MRRIFPRLALVFALGLGFLIAVAMAAPGGKGAAGGKKGPPPGGNGGAVGGGPGGNPGGGGGPGNGPPNPLFAVFDLDHDGVISAKEFETVVQMIKKLDANGDGQISKSEFETALGAGGSNIAQADDVFGKLDQDGDGTVSLDEMSSALKGRGRRHHASYNVIERMIAREAQASSAPASLSVSV